MQQAGAGRSPAHSAALGTGRLPTAAVRSQAAVAADNAFFIGGYLSSSISYIMMGILWLCFSYQLVLLFLDSISSSARYPNSGSCSFSFLFSFFSCFLIALEKNADLFHIKAAR